MNSPVYNKLLVHNPIRKKYIGKIRRKDHCYFCKGIKDQLLIKEYSYWRVLANLYPFVDSAILIVPKRHIEFTDETLKKEWVELQTIMDDLVWTWKKMYKDKPKSKKEKMLDEGKPSYNFYINNGEHSGQTVRHLHWHFIPRVYRTYTGMELAEPFHKVRVTAKETQKLFKNNLRK